MIGDSWASVGRRRAAAFAAGFAAVFLLGGLLIAVESSELHSPPTEIAVALPLHANADERIAFDKKLREARDRAADARRNADVAELALFEFLNARFVDSTEQAIRAPREPKSPTSPLPVGPTIRPNPEWVALNRQLAEMQRTRGELLEKLTPAHPTVQSLDSQIAKLQDQLAATPAELPANLNEIASAAANKTPLAPPLPSSGDAIDAPSANPPSAVLQQHYREMLLAAGRAREAYRAAVQSETSLWNACPPGMWQSASDRAGNVDLRPNDRESGLSRQAGSEPGNRPIPIGAIAILTLLSILAGVLAARRLEGRTLTFMSADEIEATLGLPVLGRVGPGTNRRSENAA
ncbi:MAG TPA: hypothetical protein VHX65_18300 [Pirellulales bacterium]|nr:hypothetical protein [Pirellulales bacterium]